MDIKQKLESFKLLAVISEALTDYVSPIFTSNDISMILEGKNPTVIKATMPKEEFVILNNHIPNWVVDVNSKCNESDNILIIEDIDKIKIEDQELFLDIIKDNQISTVDLPSNLKIILKASSKCEISSKIRSYVEYY